MSHADTYTHTSTTVDIATRRGSSSSGCGSRRESKRNDLAKKITSGSPRFSQLAFVSFDLNVVESDCVPKLRAQFIRVVVRSVQMGNFE